MSSSLGQNDAHGDLQASAAGFRLSTDDSRRRAPQRLDQAGLLARPAVFQRHAQMLIAAMATGYGWTLLSLAGLTVGDLGGIPAWLRRGAASAAARIVATASAASLTGGGAGPAIAGDTAGSAVVGGATAWGDAARWVAGWEDRLLAHWPATLAIAALLLAAAVAARRFGRPVALTLPVDSVCRLHPAGRHGLLIECIDPPADPDRGQATAVRAPCGGTVVEVAEESPGSRLVLRRPQGGHVVLARLRSGSVVVRPGQRVEAGQVLAACGVGQGSTAGGAGLAAAGAAQGLAGRRLLLLRVQSGSGRFARGRRYDLAGCVTFGNGGPRWNALTAAVAGAVVQRGVAGSVGVAPGRACYRVEAQGGQAERFAGGTRALELCVRSVEQQLVIEEGPAAPPPARSAAAAATSRLLLRRDAEAWRLAGPHRGLSPLLRCLRLAMPTLPASRLPGMWWCDWSQEPRRRSPWIGLPWSRLPWRRLPGSRLRVFTSCADEDAEATTLIARIRPAIADLPHSIRMRFAAGRGLVALQAEFADGWLHFGQTEFAPHAAPGE